MNRALVVLSVVLLCSPILAQKSDKSANELARVVINNELKAEREDHSHWMLRLDTEKPNHPEEVDEVVETKSGDLQYPILVNGKPATEQQRKDADKRLQQLAKDPDKLHKTLQDKNKDEDHSQRMLKVLPQAFLFSYGERRGNLVQLNFTPNPRFKPPNREARVFHAMEGSIWVDSKQHRLARMAGHLTHEVDFGGGLLGHLDKGGQFDVKQEEVAPGFWELTALNVQMNGKALLFKTISVRQKYSRSDFKRVPDSLSAADGLRMLRRQVQAQSASGLP